MSKAELISKPGVISIFLLGTFPLLINGFYNLAILDSSLTLYWVIEVCTWVVLPIILLRYGARQNLFDRSSIGIRGFIGDYRRPIFKIPFYAIYPVFVFFFCLWAQRLSTHAFETNYLAQQFDYSQTFPKTMGLRLLVAFYHSITAGVVEEIYYRGLLRLVFKSKIVFIFVSSTLFSLIHWEDGIYTMLPAFMLGLLNAIVYCELGSLIPLIGGHFFTDFMYFLRYGVI